MKGLTLISGRSAEQLAAVLASAGIPYSSNIESHPESKKIPIRFWIQIEKRMENFSRACELLGKPDRSNCGTQMHYAVYDVSRGALRNLHGNYMFREGKLVIPTDIR